MCNGDCKCKSITDNKTQKELIDIINNKRSKIEMSTLLDKIYPGATDLVRMMLDSIGEDVTREGLHDTPYRVVKSWLELYAGYHQNPKEILSTTFQENITYDEIIICKNIEFKSMCEHHMLPFTGIAHVGYLPNQKVVGLSKLPRLVECFAKRLQIQEQMTSQIADSMMNILEPQGVAVVIEAHHMCMSCRGVKKESAKMVTSAMRGKFKEQPQTRNEFLTLINK